MSEPSDPPPKRSLRVSLLDYGAGNVRSVRNAILACGYDIIDMTDPSQIDDAEVVVFPGVGSYGSAMSVLTQGGYVDPLRRYLEGRYRPYLGICLGMQTLFESSDESHPPPDGDGTGGSDPIPGLGVIPGRVVRFEPSEVGVGSVPHIGWNGRIPHKSSPVFAYVDPGEEVYFVHSYYAPIRDDNEDWVLTSTTYGGRRFVSSVQSGCVVATQFHPEKSGRTGLNIVRGFLEAVENGTLSKTEPIAVDPTSRTVLVKRVVVALDVRSDDSGDLVVTKGDQYDVRENEREGAITGRGGVRNLGKPVALAGRYYEEGADEIAFLNITSFRSCVIGDLPMLQVLEESSKSIFVPLTVGGGIRSYADPNDATRVYSALEVASRYFRAGADKVSIGSDAVYAAEAYVASGGTKTGRTSIEMISSVYGVQAVVVSVDPKRAYVKSRDDADPRHVVVDLDESDAGPGGERLCWYRCTVRGGREERDICAVTLCGAVEDLGAGEIMLNCIDMDGQCDGYDIPLMRAVARAVSVPVIASSGAGRPHHFTDVFRETEVRAALAAGMFHRREVGIDEVKRHMMENGVPARRIS